jgi:hypothetical protein
VYTSQAASAVGPLSSCSLHPSLRDRTAPTRTFWILPKDKRWGKRAVETGSLKVESHHDNLLLLVTNSPLPASVADLWMQGTKQWDHQLLSTAFSPQVVQEIEATPVVHSNQ